MRPSQRTASIGAINEYGAHFMQTSQKRGAALLTSEGHCFPRGGSELWRQRRGAMLSDVRFRPASRDRRPDTDARRAALQTIRDGGFGIH